MIKIVDAHDSFYHVHTNTHIVMKPMSLYHEHIKQLRDSFSVLGERGKEVMDFKENYFTTECHHVDDILAYVKQNPEIKPLKVEIMDGDEEHRVALENILQEAGFFAYSSFMTALEVINPKSNKGAAIKRYVSLYGNAKTYGIGDAENDISMFDVVDVSVAMGNANGKIREYCDKITGNCLDGGLGTFILKNIIQK